MRRNETLNPKKVPFFSRRNGCNDQLDQNPCFEHNAAKNRRDSIALLFD
jgi:hypothetical protein